MYPTYYWTVYTLLIFISLLVSVYSLLCYECSSAKVGQEDCGPYFRKSSFTPENCTEEATACAIQRQEHIKRKQVAAIVRGCYYPGSKSDDLGLNSSVGCREWTNPEDHYTALYCFCTTDYCNAAPAQHTLAGIGYYVTVILSLWPLRAPLWQWLS